MFLPKTMPANLLVGRKVYHVLMGLACFSLYAFFLDRHQALIVLGTAGLSSVVLDAIRLRLPKINDMLVTFFAPILRASERHSLTGHSYFVLGMIFLTYFFEKNIALLALLYLSFGDPAASTVGGIWGKHKVVGNKSWEGAAANWVVSFLVTLAFLSYTGGCSTGTCSLRLFTFSVIGATISVFAELVPFPIDDNFSIPVVSATLLSLTQTLI